MTFDIFRFHSPGLLIPCVWRGLNGINACCGRVWCVCVCVRARMSAQAPSAGGRVVVTSPWGRRSVKLSDRTVSVGVLQSTCDLKKCKCAIPDRCWTAVAFSCASWMGCRQKTGCLPTPCHPCQNSNWFACLCCSLHSRHSSGVGCGARQKMPNGAGLCMASCAHCARNHCPALRAWYGHARANREPCVCGRRILAARALHRRTF